MNTMITLVIGFALGSVTMYRVQRRRRIRGYDAGYAAGRLATKRWWQR